MKIPDSVMGITFLAAGTSVPEAVSSVIVAKQGMYVNLGSEYKIGLSETEYLSDLRNTDIYVSI